MEDIYHATATVLKIITSIDFFVFLGQQDVSTSNCIQIMDEVIARLQNYPHYEFIGVGELEQLKHFIDVFIIHFSRLGDIDEFMIFLAKFKDYVNLYENELRSGKMTNYQYNLIYIDEYILKFDSMFHAVLDAKAVVRKSVPLTPAFETFELLHIKPFSLFRIDFTPFPRQKCFLHFVKNTPIVKAPACLDYYFIAVVEKLCNKEVKYLLLREYEAESLKTSMTLILSTRTVAVAKRNHLEVFLGLD